MAMPLGVLLLLFLLATACAPASSTPVRITTAPTPTPAVPQPVVLPRDEAPHDNLSEWWYYTGHLKSSAGKQYGFELVIFQASRARSPVGYAAHFAVTDHQRRTFSYEELAERSLDLQGGGKYRLEVGGWRMGGDGDEHYLQADGRSYGLDLRLRSVKPPVLHNKIGWISFGPAGDSYYYSRTRLDVSGTLWDGGRSEAVTGLAWMDHQWGDFVVVNGGGWDWFAVQLDDGSDVMVTVLRAEPGNTAAVFGSYSDPEGRVTDLKASDLEVKPTGSWTSPHSGAAYPSGWKLRLPARGLDLELRPVVPDQELNTLQSTGVSYWEGDVAVSGTRNGSPIGGRAYVELTGYAK